MENRFPQSSVEEGNEEDADEESDRAGRSKRQRIRYGDNSEGENEGMGKEDDDEANADLSLHIVAKAQQRRKETTISSSTTLKFGIEKVEVVDSRTPHVISTDEETNFVVEGRVDGAAPDDRSLCVEDGEVVEPREPVASRDESLEEGELQEDADVDLNLLVDTELPDVAGDDIPANPDEQEERGKRKNKKKKEKRDKKEKKRKQKSGGGGEDTTITVGNSYNKSIVIEIKDGDAEESMVMRKLLRGPRYFDPPEEQGQSCFNCGNVGHLAAACPDGPRLKPCYVCGGFGHEGRECPQKTECYVCGKVGHIAKICPNKGAMRASALLWNGGGEGGNVCLLCGRQGHAMSSCYDSYDAEDLAQVQCYLCCEMGHLSCVAADTSPVPISCYECGDMGHTGAGCARPHKSDRDRDRGGGGIGMTSVCFKCGEEGHYARGCSKRNAPWPAPWPTEGMPGGSRSRNESRYGTPRSAARTSRWMDLQEREPRWTPLRRLSAVGAERWTDFRGHRMDSGGRGVVASPAYVDEDIGNYMGPIGNFTIESPSDGYGKKRRKRSWASTSAR